jgi:thiol-disulfide isomerase/thioredoxin
MGKSLNIADSGYLNNGSVVFQKNNDTLPSGIYSIVFPGKRHTADFFIDRSPEISIQADTNDLLNMKVTGSPENPLFQQYQLFIANKGRLMQQEKNLYNVSTTKEDSALHEKNYTKINEELNEFRNKIIKENPQSMMTVLLKAMKDPEVLHKKPLTRQDSLENYYHYKAHFWDGVSFMDSRILRTPFFLPRLEQYYRNLLPQEPDSIIRDIDERMLYARNNLEMKKFMLNWLTDEYINPKYMGQDAVFIHLFNKYHNAGELPWLNEKQKETVSKRAYMQMANQIGIKASDLNMVDSSGKTSRLYDLRADYTVVIFWDPTCGHCKEELPHLDSLYQASWKKKGVRIYSVLSENEKYEEWKRYIISHGNINEWTHVYETKAMEEAVVAAKVPGFKQLYDVISTPTLFLLDSDKRIIGKKLNWTQLNELLQVKWNQKK